MSRADFPLEPPQQELALLRRQVVDVWDFLHFLDELVQEEAQESRCEGLEGPEGRGGGTGGTCGAQTAVSQERRIMEHGNMQTTCNHPAHDDDDGHEVMSMLLKRQGWVEGSPLHLPGEAAFSVPTWC